MNKRLISLLLCALMLAPTLASCSDKGSTTENTNTPSSDSAPTATDSTDAPEAEAEPEVTRATTPDNLPSDLNFNGTTINIFHFGEENTLKYDTAGELTGDVVSDAIYNKNLAVEDRLNVKLTWIAGSGDWDGFPSEVNLALQAATGDYDVIEEENSRLFQQSLNGYYYDLLSQKYLDIDQPWWYSKLMEESSLDNSKRYFFTGDITLTTLFGASTVYFNKAIYNDHFGDYNDLYNYVLEGTWTVEKFAQLCKDVATDLNGDGNFTDDDLLGFRFEEWGIPNFMSMSTGLSYITRDEEGFPVLDIYNERSIEWADWLYKLLYTDNMSLLGDKATSFKNQTSLFLVNQLGTANTLRDLSFEYGFLPYPKLSEDLDYACGAATANGMGVAIPTSIDAAKLDAVCATLEAMAAQSYRKVVPAWYETALKIKYVEEAVDAQMIDLIYDHITSPFIMMADKQMNTGSLFKNAVYGASSEGTFSSYWAKQEKPLGKMMEKVLNSYKSIAQ